MEKVVRVASSRPKPKITLQKLKATSEVTTCRFYKYRYHEYIYRFKTTLFNIRRVAWRCRTRSNIVSRV